MRSKPRVGLLDLRQVAIGVSPGGKKIAVCGGCLRHITGHSVGLSDAIKSMAPLWALLQGFVESVPGLLPLLRFEVGVADTLLLRAKIPRRLRIAEVLFFFRGLLQQLDSSRDVSLSGLQSAAKVERHRSQQ